MSEEFLETDPICQWCRLRISTRKRKAPKPDESRDDLLVGKAMKMKLSSLHDVQPMSSSSATRPRKCNLIHDEIPLPFCRKIMHKNSFLGARKKTHEKWKQSFSKEDNNANGAAACDTDLLAITHCKDLTLIWLRTRARARAGRWKLQSRFQLLIEYCSNASRLHLKRGWHWKR